MVKLTRGLNPDDGDRTIITTVKPIIPPAERRSLRGVNADGVPLVLLDPAYWKTDPDDDEDRDSIDAEYRYRIGHRRIEFTKLLSDLMERFHLRDKELDDWDIDESCHSYYIPMSQIADARKLITNRGFDFGGYDEMDWVYNEGDNWADFWVEDPVVAALMPEGYNCYTIRSKRLRP